MSFKKFNEQELQAYKSGKIAGYYSRKARERRQKKAKQVFAAPKYSTCGVDEAFRRALERSYGSEK